MEKSKKLIIVGDSGFAEIAHEYFTADSVYEVVAFTVESGYLKEPSKRGLPVLAFETIEHHYSPQDYEIYVAATYTQFNRLRTRLAATAKEKGYRLASYISSRAFIWANAELGEHCFIFEDNTIQPFVKIGANVILWSGNHIGHHSIVRENCFISSHVVISGYCDIGANSFLGVNCTLANNLIIGADNWIGPGLTIMKNTEPDSLFKAEHAVPVAVSAKRFFKLRD